MFSSGDDKPRTDSSPPRLPGDLGTVARGASLGLFGGVLRQGLSALTVLVLARLLKDDYGLVAAGTACAVLLAVIGKAGLDMSVARWVAIYRSTQEREKIKGILYGGLLWSAGISLLLTLLVMLLAPGIAGLFGKPEFAGPLRFFVGWVPPAVITMVIVYAILARGSARARVVVRDITVPGLYLLLGGVGVNLWPDARVAGLAYATASLIGVGLCFYYLHRFFSWLSAVRAAYQNALLLSTALPILLVDLAAAGTGQADVVIMFKLLPTAGLVGIYAAASRLAMFGNLPLNALNQIISPVISRLHYQHKPAELDSLLKTLTRLSLALAVPMLAVFIGLARPMMGLLGPAFVAGEVALIIISIGVLVNVGTGSVGFALVMTEYQWLAFANNVLCLALLVGLNWWLVPLYSITGGALALAISTSVVNLMRLAQVRFLLRANPVSVPMAKPLAAGLVAGGAAYGMAQALGLTGAEPLGFLAPMLLGLALVSVLLYAAVVLLLGFEESDRQAAAAILERMRKRSSGKQ